MKEVKELVSVIIPVYNVEAYLNTCVESVINQTYRFLEIWLVDDGSTDQSAFYCDEWKKKDERIHVIHQINQGLSVARNVALDRCNGAWITFVDSDDVIADDYVETLLCIAKKYNVFVTQCGNEQLTEKVNNNDVYEQGVMQSRDFLLSSKYKVMAWGKLYHYNILETFRFPAGKIHEDVALTYKIVYEAKKIAYTDKELYFCNSRSDSINAKERYYVERLAILQFRKEQIEYYERMHEPELMNKAWREYAYDLLMHYNKVKRILKNNVIANRIKQAYRENFCKIRKVKGISCKTKILLWICYIIPEMWNIVMESY